MCKKPLYKLLKPYFYAGKYREYNTWTTIDDYKKGRAVKVDCGKCLNCRLKKMYKWKIRLLMESESIIKKQGFLYFITLTYNNENLNKLENGVVYEVQKMLKRIRKNNKQLKLKYFFVVELGSQTGRLHYHGIFFANIDFLKEKEGGRFLKGNYYYQNDAISWKNGFYSINKVKTNIVDIKRVLNYVLKYLLKNPLHYIYSKTLGYEIMKQNTFKNGSVFVYDKKLFKVFNYRNYFTIDEIIDNQKQAKKGTVPVMEHIELKKEVKEW